MDGQVLSSKCDSKIENTRDPPISPSGEEPDLGEWGHHVPEQGGDNRAPLMPAVPAEPRRLGNARGHHPSASPATPWSSVRRQSQARVSALALLMDPGCLRSFPPLPFISLN